MTDTVVYEQVNRFGSGKVRKINFMAFDSSPQV